MRPTVPAPTGAGNEVGNRVPFPILGLHGGWGPGCPESRSPTPGWKNTEVVQGVGGQPLPARRERSSPDAPRGAPSWEQEPEAEQRPGPRAAHAAPGAVRARPLAIAPSLACPLARPPARPPAPPAAPPAAPDARIPVPSAAAGGRAGGGRGAGARVPGLARPLRAAPRPLRRRCQPGRSPRGPGDPARKPARCPPEPGALCRVSLLGAGCQFRGAQPRVAN